MSADAVDALQQCLAAEHQAVWAYGLLGGELAGVDPGGPDYDRARADYDAHQRQRDVLATRIRSLGETPVPAEVAYAEPRPVTDRRSAVALALHVESALARTYAWAVAQTSGVNRGLVSDGLTDATLRRAGWGGTPQALPGLSR